MSSGSSKMPGAFIIPYSHGEPLQFGSTGHSSRGYNWIESTVEEGRDLVVKERILGEGEGVPRPLHAVLVHVLPTHRA